MSYVKLTNLHVAQQSLYESRESCQRIHSLTNQLMNIPAELEQFTKAIRKRTDTCKCPQEYNDEDFYQNNMVVHYSLQPIYIYTES